MHSFPKALFVSHGGGPLPLLGDPGHAEMVSCLKDIAADIPRPDTILVVSAHWEESVPTVTAASHPSLIYDYYGFPPESYAIEYACPGAPSFAREVHAALEAAGIGARIDPTRGLDHGVFVPLKIMYPTADIPCVQLSLAASLDPDVHIAMGRALSVLSRSGLLIIGSGFSFHNLRAFFERGGRGHSPENVAFEAWLANVLTDDALSEAERQRALVAWSQAPGARYCHPREEHLLPLHVCYGVAQSACTKRHEVVVMNKKSSFCVW